MPGRNRLTFQYSRLNEELTMKTFRYGIASAAMLAFLLTVSGCGETSDKAKQQTKAETKTARETEAVEEVKLSFEEQPPRSEGNRIEQSEGGVQ